MKRKKSMPRKGQFVAVWEFNKTIWCSTFQWYRGDLYVYNEPGADPIDEDDVDERGITGVPELEFFTPVEGYDHLLDQKSTRFLVV